MGVCGWVGGWVCVCVKGVSVYMHARVRVCVRARARMYVSRVSRAVGCNGAVIECVRVYVCVCRFEWTRALCRVCVSE